MSLGLIVTELVINALKHGFQGKRSEILVSYDVQNLAGLSVSTMDRGPRKRPATPTFGSRTSIVEAWRINSSHGRENEWAQGTMVNHRIAVSDNL